MGLDTMELQTKNTYAVAELLIRGNTYFS